MMLRFQVRRVILGLVPTRSKRGGHGGARRGAGRPRLMQNRVAFTVTIEARHYGKLVQLANERSVTLATVVREALGAYVERRRRG